MEQTLIVIDSPRSRKLMESVFLGVEEIQLWAGKEVIRTGRSYTFWNSAVAGIPPQGECPTVKASDGRSGEAHIPEPCLHLVTTKRRNASVSKRPKGKLIRFTKSERKLLLLVLQDFSLPGHHGAESLVAIRTIHNKLK